jgi:hypothetical protein
MQEWIAQIAGLAIFVGLFLVGSAENVGVIYPAALSVSVSPGGSLTVSTLKR